MEAHNGRITANDLRRRTRRYATSEEAEAALDRAVDAGKGRWDDAPANQTGGRPTRYFVLVSSVSVSETPTNIEGNEGFGYGDNGDTGDGADSAGSHQTDTPQDDEATEWTG